MPSSSDCWKLKDNTPFTYPTPILFAGSSSEPGPLVVWILCKSSSETGPLVVWLFCKNCSSLWLDEAVLSMSRYRDIAVGRYHRGCYLTVLYDHRVSIPIYNRHKLRESNVGLVSTTSVSDCIPTISVV